jgi:teichuronic acid exporter
VSEHPVSLDDALRTARLPKRVVASLLWLGSASVFKQLGSWISTLLVVRLLSPDDYGLIAMALAPVGFLILVGDLGVGTVVVQSPSLSRPQLQALFGASLLAYLLGAIVIFAAAPLVAMFFAEPRLTSLVRVLSLCFVAVGFAALPQALMARALQFDRKAKIDLLTALVSSLVALLLALTGWGVWSLVGAVLANHFFRAIASQIIAPCLVRPILSLALLRGNAHFGGWVTLDRLLWFVHTNIDIAIAGRALGGAMVGLYTIALTLASIPLDKVMSLVTEISLSAFSRMQDDRDRVRDNVLRALESVSLLAFPTFFGMAIVAPEAVDLFLGPQWTPAVLPLQILCLAFPFRALGVFFTPALFGTGQPRLVVENNALTLVAVTAAILVGVNWGVAGVCAGWVFGYVPVFFVMARRTMLALDIPVRDVARAVGFSLASAVTMVAAIVLTHPIIDNVIPPAAELAGMILIGVGAYAAIVLAFRPRMLRTFWMLGVQK